MMLHLPGFCQICCAGFSNRPVKNITLFIIFVCANPVTFYTSDYDPLQISAVKLLLHTRILRKLDSIKKG